MLIVKRNQNYIMNLLKFRFSEISMSRRDTAKFADFPGFSEYFGLNIVFSFISALYLTGYNTKSQKIHAEKDR